MEKVQAYYLFSEQNEVMKWAQGKSKREAEALMYERLIGWRTADRKEGQAARGRGMKK